MATAFGRVINAVDLAATFALALQGALVAIASGLDPVGVLVIAFVTALGGGIIRDVLLGAHPVAAISGWAYPIIVLVGAALTWLLASQVLRIPPMLLITLDAAGLALAAIAGTEKALTFKINPLVATFVGTAGGVGGGVLRDIILNQVPAVLRTDVYATAAFAGAVVIVIGHRAGWSPRVTAVLAGVVCFGLRMTAVALHWQLPHQTGVPLPHEG